MQDKCNEKADGCLRDRVAISWFQEDVDRMDASLSIGDHFDADDPESQRVAITVVVLLELGSGLPRRDKLRLRDVIDVISKIR